MLIFLNNLFDTIFRKVNISVYIFVNKLNLIYENYNIKEVKKIREINSQNMIENILKDPITALLLKNSKITRIQFETFIIDVLTDILSEKTISFNKKTLYRNKKISRGSFSRTLQQARTNVISSIFTIILLYYIGIFETQPFNEFKILSEKLKDYIEIIKNLDNQTKTKLLKRVEQELIEGIEKFSKPTSIKMV